MSCQHCVDAVTEEVSAVDGVDEVLVDLEAATVTVSGAQFADEQVRAAIDEAGYAVD